MIYLDHILHFKHYSYIELHVVYCKYYIKQYLVFRMNIYIYIYLSRDEYNIYIYHVIIHRISYSIVHVVHNISNIIR